MAPSLGELELTAQLYRHGALLARAVDLEHDRTARDHPATASWRYSSTTRLLGAWHRDGGHDGAGIIEAIVPEHL
jgi:hypothetical protein